MTAHTCGNRQDDIEEDSRTEGNAEVHEQVDDSRGDTGPESNALNFSMLSGVSAE
jgi:hypothetical protein